MNSICDARWKLPNHVSEWRPVNTYTALHRRGSQESGKGGDHYWLDTERKEGKETVKEVRNRRRRNGESDEWMSWNVWKKKKKVCSSLFEVLFVSLVDLLLWVRGGVRASHDGGSGWGEVKGHRCICSCVLCVTAGYQLLSGDGSLSRCMAALWCFMLSRYSCWETASTEARISSSSQSVRPETQQTSFTDRLHPPASLVWRTTASWKGLSSCSGAALGLKCRWFAVYRRGEAPNSRLLMVHRWATRHFIHSMKKDGCRIKLK